MPGPAWAALVAAGDVVRASAGPDKLEMQLSSGGLARLDVMDGGIVRVRVAPGGALSTRISPAIAPSGLNAPGAVIVDIGDYWYVGTSLLQVFVQKHPFRVIALDASFKLLSFDAEPAVMWDMDTGRVLTRRWALPDDHYFGLGMRGGAIDRRGRAMVMRNTDAFGYAEDALYQSYPFFYTVSGGKAHGVFLDMPASPFFDMDSANQGVLLFGAEHGDLDYYIIAGPQPLDVAERYAHLTGFNQLPPKWTLGYHHSRYGWTSADQIKSIGQQLRAQDFPTDSLWFDIDYMANRSKFSWNSATFPNPSQLHQDLDALGLKRVYIDEPCIRTDDRLWPYLQALGYFVKDQSHNSLVNNIWFGDVSWIDFTRSDASSWVSQQIATFVSTGVDGLWNDLNEPANNFMPDAVFDFDGAPRGELESRNLYALLVNRAALAGQLAAHPNVRPWNFSRSGYSGIQRYAHTWSGDANSDWNTLRINIEMSVSMGLSGQNQFGHDTGGFLGSPNGELFLRWLEFSSFTPLFRNHSINTAAPREPWVFGEPYTGLIRDVIKRRYRYMPYTYSLFEAASRTGQPVLTPTMFYAAADSGTYSRDHEYLFGANLLVAPVYTEGARTRSVYLPYGSDWINVNTDELFAGGQEVVVDAPLGQTPLFVRDGTILPLGPNLTHVDDGTPADLDIQVYPGRSGEFVLYEDDGKSFNYRGGAFRYTRISSRVDGGHTTVDVAPLYGTYNPGARHLVLQLRRHASAPSGVSMNGQLLPALSQAAQLSGADTGWFYDVNSRTLKIKFPGGDGVQTVVVL